MGNNAVRAWIIGLVIFFVLYPTASWSEAQNEATAETSALPTCNTFRSIYGPSSNEMSGNFDYRLRIQKNENYLLGNNAKYFFQFDILKKNSSNIVAAITADYKCFLGDNPRCYLQFSDKDDLDVVALDRRFNPIFSYEKNTPHSLVIPRAGLSLKDKSRISKVKFYTDEKILPYLEFPKVWIYEECK